MEKAFVDVMKMIREMFRGFLHRLSDQTLAYYGERLVTLGVFGSVGRGTPRADSDIDLIIISDGLPDGRLKRMDEFKRVEEALQPDLFRLKQAGINTCLSPVIKSPVEVKAGSLLFLDMIEDINLLFDRNEFFRLFLEGFRQRLQKIGARRVRRDNAWYWVLKEDYREGEVFEL